MYHGENTPKEHAEEAARLGGMDAYSVRMVNALLGVARTEAALPDGVKLDDYAPVTPGGNSSSPPPAPDG